jgi:hypothetical protein
VLAPALVLITASFVHFRMTGGEPVQGVTVIPGPVLRNLALMLNSLVAFSVLYALAIYHRRSPLVHARYMLCTVFPLFTPVTDRLIGMHLPEVIGFLPRIDGSPVLPVAGFLLADLILVVLAVLDWRSSRRKEFFYALGVLVAYHVTTLTLHRVPAWNAFGVWFVGAPLS